VVTGCPVERGLFVLRGRVEALEARVAVVVTVRVVAVADEVARDLDLVRRVVREVPGLGRVAEADLEQRRRNEEHRADDGRDPDRGPAGPRTQVPGDSCGERHEEAGEDRGGADDPEVPLAVCGAHQWAQNPVRVHGSRRERPGVCAELRNRDRDDDAERGEQDERFR